MAANQNESPKEKDLWNSLPTLKGIERGQTYFDLSLMAFENGQHTKSLVLAESACECFLEHQDDLGYANCLTSVAFNLKELNKISEAIRAMVKAVIRYAKVGDEQEWEYRFYLAQWLADCEEYELAHLQFMKLLEHSRNNGCSYVIAGAADNVAKALCDLGRCAEAIDYFKESREILKREKEPAAVGITDIWIARCYNHLKDGLSAMAYAQKAISVFESVNETLRRAQSHAQLGRALNNLGRYEESLAALDTAHKYVTGFKSIDFYAISTIQKGKVQALRGLGRESEAVEIERRNSAINEILGK
jgi:tetratricopeptide (TPR) repeat protein